MRTLSFLLNGKQINGSMQLWSRCQNVICGNWWADLRFLLGIFEHKNNKD